jgi:tetratricopeptide (TPR) repeat protein
LLTGIIHEHQGWNNCGPTTFGMTLSYWGMNLTQQDLAPLMKPDPEDKHVDVEDMEAYAREAGIGITVRVNGSLDGLKELLRAGYPVIVASWHVRDAQDQLGHYRLVSGYDDSLGEFILQDSLDGPDLPIGYQELDELWRVYNRTYVLAYPIEKAGEVATLIGEDLDDAGMYERALATAQIEAANPPAECVVYAKCEDWVTFSWFNVGSSLTALGRHEEAAAAYDQARQLGLPFRMLWYQFGPYESYYAVGRHADVIALADATLAVTDNLEESHYWRGMSRQALGDVEGARSDFEAALRYHAGWPPALAALASLE